MSEKAQQEQNVLANLGTLLPDLGTLLPDLESVYEDIHSHPELSMEENRTAGIAAGRLRAAGYEVTTGVGKTRVVAVLRNGEGPTIMLRADMDSSKVPWCTAPEAAIRSGTCAVRWPRSYPPGGGESICS
jgi:metal-dependent amidase/aminoacylase/carboxypeptidase family protein